MDHAIDARAKSLDISFESMRDQYLDKISLRRRVTMEDVAAMALFLSSKAATKFASFADRASITLSSRKFAFSSSLYFRGIGYGDH